MKNYNDTETEETHTHLNGRKRAVKKVRVRVPSIEEIEASRLAREEELEALRLERREAREVREEEREIRRAERSEAREDRADARMDKLIESLKLLGPVLVAFAEQSLNHKVDMDQLKVYSELISLRKKANGVDGVESVIDESESDLNKVKSAAEKVKTAKSGRK